LRALAHIASHEDILVAYLRLTGLSAEELHTSAAEASTLGSILDYFLQNEKRLVAFCEAENISPDHLAKARRLLPGGETVPYSS